MVVAQRIGKPVGTTDGHRADEGGSAVPLREWLSASALPMWSRTGVDTVSGGFHEKIDLTGRPVDEPRRARVVARQIYVFATAARRGWLADGDALVSHGLEFLRRMRLDNGLFAASIRPDGTVVDAAFDLYEHAFILFALAAASRGRPERAAVLRPEAEALLARLRDGYAHPGGGFQESSPATVPLKSNPHMHLLEAAMAWVEISEGAAQDVWAALTDELVGLCLDRFVDAGSGALREYFDADWRPMPGASGSIVEPGHQFEWSWLLRRYEGRAHRTRARAAAARLLEIGERHGVDRTRGVAVDVLDDAFRVTAETAKLWPQTERIKAWHAARGSGADDAAMRRADLGLDDAIDGLTRFFLDEPAGLWQEQMRADGSFVEQHCRASSLYHIVCAIDTAAGDDAPAASRATERPL